GDRQFALSAGENHSLNLVVQKQAGATPVNAVLDALASTAAKDPTALRDQLSASLQSTTPDSDLYVNRYRIDSTGTQLEQLVSTSVPGGQWQVITNDANPLKPAPITARLSQPAVSLSGNTQLVRSLLYPQQQTQPLPASALPAPSLLRHQDGAPPAATRTAAAPAAPVGSPFSTEWAPIPVRLDVTGPLGGAIDVGLKAENIYRWSYQVAKKGKKTLTPTPIYITSRAILEGIVPGSDEYAGSAAILNKGLETTTREQINAEATFLSQFSKAGKTPFTILSYDSSNAATSAVLNLRLQGGLGTIQGGNNNLKAISFAKFVAGIGTDTAQAKRGSSQPNAKFFLGPYNSLTVGQRAGAFNLGNIRMTEERIRTGNFLRGLKPENLFISRTWNFGIGGSIGSAYDYGSTDRTQLKSLATKEAVSLDLLYRKRSINGQWLGEQLFDVTSGFYWQQLFDAASGALPAYAGIIGLAGGGVAAGLNIWSGVSGYRRQGIRAFANSPASLASSTRQTQYTTSSVLVGLTGLASAAAVPLALALGPEPPQTRFSRGIQAQLRISGSKLYRGISGIDFNLANRFYSQGAYTNIGSGASPFSKLADQVYLDFGIRLVGGLRVPLISYYKNILIRDDAAPQTPARVASAGAPQIQPPENGVTIDVDFTADGAYPVAYIPTSGSPLFAGPPLISPEDARTFLLGDADVNRLRLLSLGSSATPGPSGPVQIQLEKQGSGLNPGLYRAVRILGVPLLAGGYATVDVTVDGSGQVSALSNLQGADYLSLPEKSPLSGVFYLPLDIYQIDAALGRAMAPLYGAAGGSAPVQPPVLSIPASSSGGSGLSNRRLLSFDRVAVVAGGAGYQRLTQLQAGDPPSAEVPASNDNAAYTYTGVPVGLLRGGALVPLLGHDAADPATATVHLAGGSIRRIDLDQTLYIPEATNSAADAYSLALTLPAGITPLSQASLSLSPSSVELSNLVEESEFSAQPGAVDTGVYLTAGQASQLALDAADGYRRLQNRVAYTSLDANGKPFTVYLNSSGQSFATASQLTNEQIVNGTAPEFSFASHPTSISISGGKSDQLKGDTLVMWVEAGDPLIPYSSADGNSNYQAYLTAAYGRQAINYRVAINGSATNWQKPDSATLYRPDNAIISDLQLVNVPDPRTGEQRTLLVWAEISIDAIKGLTAEYGSGLSLPATIKSTWINADSDTINWGDLSEQVVTIPWDPTTSVGMGIADLSMASQTLKLADGTVLQAPLISWSQSVRTPYQESVLRDQPSIYLPMAGLAPGESSLNLGTDSPTLSTTFASSRGLDFNVPGALAVEQTTAVRNSDGTGVLSTGLGGFNALSLGLLSQIPAASLPAPPAPDPAGPPTPSLPYSIEFWTQLQPGTNPQGAGLVAMGQPSATAVGAAGLPQGWLLQSSFQVERISLSDAASLGLIDPAQIPSGQADALYGWSWSLQADGANSTAMNGNGGSNLYANAVTLANLSAGQSIAGVEAFLGSYGLTAAQLSGLNGTPANTMALVPSTSLAFTDFLDPQSQRPTSALNGVAIDPSTTLLNQGFVSAADAAANANLNTMLNSLWQYQQATGEVKVVFGADPKAAPQQAAATPDPFSPESYAGYALDFALWGGPAISVNGSGQVVFDVSRDLALTAPAGSDLRDGSWHYVAVSYAPEFVDFTADGSTVQVPTDRGTASLFIDGQLVSSSPVSGVYLPFNVNGEAQLLTHNAGGAIDHLAVYSAAINALNPHPPGSDLWPKLTATDALAELEALGAVPLAGSPDPGQIPGAVTAHWLAHTVNPLGALQATYTSSYRP
ncbi:MAG: hypothetical protein VKI83_03920, partial [Synechococcaceae cyanobacterium]|nr:hypothetical protein [Synechococcaceae cyanobacterium]